MKSKSNILVLAALAISAYCCSPRGDGSVTEVMVNGNKMYVFSLNELKKDVATIPLSSMVESLEMVQLETKEEAFFRPWFTTVTEKYIGVRQQGRPYLLFDRSGKFIGNIGSMGRGPGEYSIPPYDDIIDDENELIYLAPFSGNRIHVYNTSGQFVKDIVAPQHMAKAKIFLSDNILTVVHMAMRLEDPNNSAASAANAIAMQLDVNTGELLGTLPPPAHLVARNFDGEIFNTRNAPGIFDFHHLSSMDTLYHFDLKNNRISPAFAMSYFTTDENPWRQYLQINKDLIITAVIGRGLVATDLRHKTSSWINVENDFLGNMPAPFGATFTRNGYWAYNVQPEDLMDFIETHLEKGGLSGTDRQTLNRTRSVLKEGTNNVVFIGKLKSEVKSKLW